MEFLVEAWEPGTIWTDFGVRADIVVCSRTPWFPCEIKGSLQPFTHGFPRADIHELLTPDLLHQVIKGTFKDHFVMWVNEYLLEEHGDAHGQAIIADIDYRYVALIVYCMQLTYACPQIVSLQCHHSLDYAASQMAEIFSNGQGMTQRPS
jgi:hypothetical protein